MVLRVTAKALLSRYNLRAAHALYRRTGDWFHVLNYFPAILFDAGGYVSFPDRKDFEEFLKDRCGIGVCENENTNTLRVRDGILEDTQDMSLSQGLP